MIPIDSAGGLVYSENSRLYTLSSRPGIKVYGEKLVRIGDQEYREWNPRKSKLAAYIKTGGNIFPIKKDSRILYLGASSGTTSSHISDIAAEGKVYCVEFAPRMFRDLLNTCEARPNMLPILGDAITPEEYQFAVSKVDVVYSDVAQKRQADIIADNMDFFHVDMGMVAIKARSEDVASNPLEVYKESEKRLKERGFRILDSRDLEPYENAHRMIVFERN
ncbi:fibrillarin-like rRNA/tRNA 2'-O-methyltransferase [Candidatus Methanoplasma termitum]|uniref:Fibrillarin-like rRNA/tRNA 2'-O-methyltransferase n=1 Tax=Candidatus Methanoplasma termitum TaxID=1577791 RepID=A0A0A7LAJ1_9ARCH|nr:fibrillarin-like rRNA/tRNA 2'-O-methyltransferase [Candidatus Methanoplasma termitum]AIZ56033.1 fibrillarin-like rRNA/tRNA 2'-O-methyltransferase [Candidatus Methanoplasma termitum]MCL2333570.1 fibrillarin-like rRNA/tRNA 2'-O-methyltransferase [Candidatus Methanoplasma sp.]